MLSLKLGSSYQEVFKILNYFFPFFFPLLFYLLMY